MRIGDSDRILLLLQEQLARMGQRRTAAPAGKHAGTAPPLVRLRAIAAQKGLAEEDLRRALIRSLLVEQLGEALGNDPAFETIAGDVLRVIDEAPEGRAMLDAALRQILAAND